MCKTDYKEDAKMLQESSAKTALQNNKKNLILFLRINKSNIRAFYLFSE